MKRINFATQILNSSGYLISVRRVKKIRTTNKTFIKLKATFLVTLLCLCTIVTYAQYSITGQVLNDKNEAVESDVFLSGIADPVKSDKNGQFKFGNLSNGDYVIQVHAWGYKAFSEKVVINGKSSRLKVALVKLEEDLTEFIIEEKQHDEFGIIRLKPIEGTAIYASKKSEVVVLAQSHANLATNNSREVFSKVAGIHVWESDGAGIQLGIGGRGLSPDRTSNFNTRQNGYDISADALGYPESYYSPASQAIERIEVVRGAASLQYGTQFGGFINFRFKKPVQDKKIQFVTQQTGGSFGFFNSYNEVSGTIGKWNYFGFAQYKTGDGWRRNSGFNQHMLHGRVSYNFSKKTSITLEHTYMYYLAQQAGGLSDSMFEEDPRQSIRTRNWFKVKWNLSAILFNHQFSNKLKLNSRMFVLNAGRNSVGFLGNITRPDPLEERNLIVDTYTNIGNETRLLYTYNFLGSPANFLIGGRYYRGNTDRRQGIGTNGDDADFNFILADRNRTLLGDGSSLLSFSSNDYVFPSENVSFFSENIFPISSKFSVTPGVRFEYISTIADGNYLNVAKDLAGQVIFEQIVPEYRSNYRSFVLFGIGASYKSSDKFELYGNVSQNYRAINFNDMRIVNINLTIDPSLKDESGTSSDVGIRGNLKGVFNYDASLFGILYENKISNVSDGKGGRLRTNAPTARMLGLESFLELDFWKLFLGVKSKNSLSVFTNFSLVDAVYINTEDPQFKNNKVEMAPPIILRSGIAFKRKRFSTSLQYSYTAKHFSESTNAEKAPNPIHGAIPAYSIVDFSVKYTYKRYLVNASINNLLNEIYFTRRATGYPGPGILPSDGRSFFVTLGAKF